MKKLSPTVVEKIKRCVFTTLCVLAVATVVMQGYHVNKRWFFDRHVEQTAKTFAATDVDDAVFIKDIGHHYGVTGPLFWWHNGWHGKAVPWYWRPLTLAGFWSEYHLFGPYRFDRWQVADIVFHGLFAAVLGLFAFRVTGSRFAAPLTAILFCDFHLFDIPWISDFARFFTTPNANIILANWKDQPEAWGALCTLGALLSSMKQKWWWALGFAVASVCIKESGWLTFPMVLATLLYTGRLKQMPKSVWIGTILSWVALIALRASAGRNVFFPPPATSNHHGFGRYLKHVLDPNLQQLSTDRWPIIAFAIVIGWMAASSRPRFILRFLIAIAAGIAMSFCMGISTGSDPASGMAVMFDPNNGLVQMRTAFVEVVALVFAWRYRPVRRQAVYLYSLVLLSDLPEMAVLQPNEHMQYFTHGLQCALVVTMGLACARSMIGEVGAKMGTRQPQAKEPVAV